LETGTTNVSDIFNTETNGIVDQLKDYIDRYIGAEGKIFDSKSIIDSRVSYLDNRIDSLEDLLDEREAQLRKELLQLQEAMALLGGQQSFLQPFS